MVSALPLSKGSDSACPHRARPAGHGRAGGRGCGRAPRGRIDADHQLDPGPVIERQVDSAANPGFDDDALRLGDHPPARPGTAAGASANSPGRKWLWQEADMRPYSNWAAFCSQLLNTQLNELWLLGDFVMQIKEEWRATPSGLLRARGSAWRSAVSRGRSMRSPMLRTSKSATTLIKGRARWSADRGRCAPRDRNCPACGGAPNSPARPAASRSTAMAR